MNYRPGIPRPKMYDACAAAAAYCRRQGTDIAKLAMQFSWSNHEIHTTLVENPANIEKNVKWVEEPMDKVLLGEVQRLLASIKDHDWILGRPENN